MNQQATTAWKARHTRRDSEWEATDESVAHAYRHPIYSPVTMIAPSMEIDVQPFPL
ncbi:MULTISPECIES: hypothetical protein [Streptomyces]|uniref:Uncharacterized protein n=2 Tax=Streptomyces TaxID=1883 RepID=A0ABV9J5N8_9ACTN